MTTKLLSTLNKIPLKEEGAGGAVGGGAVSGVAMPLFAKLIKRTVNNTEETSDNSSKKEHKKPKNKKLSEYFAVVVEDITAGAGAAANPSYDKTETISRLKSLERKETVERTETQSFGLEDENGNVVRVTVKKEQAPQFEKALEQFLSSADERNGEIPEIAEILFKLKDHFDIIDVDWPNIEEDEEEKQELETPENKLSLEEPADKEASEIKAGDVDVDDAKSLLQQVVDMMKADADARKAEAVARQKEAEAKTSEAAAKQAMAKVKQEEQILDMEEWEKAKKEQEKEAKRLAKLARWKHEMEKEKGITFDEPEPTLAPENDKIEKDFTPPPATEPENVEPEEEEIIFTPKTHKPTQQITKKRMHPADVASFILNRVK